MVSTSRPADNCDCKCDNCKCDNCDCAEASLVVGLALLAIFVIIGLVVGVFFSIVVVQRVIQRHVRLLYMRGESRVHRVLDLANSPELLRATAQPLPHAYVPPIDSRAVECGTAPLMPASDPSTTTNKPGRSDAPLDAA